MACVRAAQVRPQAPLEQVWEDILRRGGGLKQTKMDWGATDWAGTPVVTAVGEKIPAICLDYGFGPDQEQVNLAERCAVLACYSHLARTDARCTFIAQGAAVRSVLPFNCVCSGRRERR